MTSNDTETVTTPPKLEPVYYRNKNSSNVYLVLGTCMESSRNKRMVLYTSVTDPNDQTMYVRYEKEFERDFEKVIPKDKVDAYMKGDI